MVRGRHVVILGVIVVLVAAVLAGCSSSSDQGSCEVRGTVGDATYQLTVDGDAVAVHDAAGTVISTFSKASVSNGVAVLSATDAGGQLLVVGPADMTQGRVEAATANATGCAALDGRVAALTIDKGRAIVVEGLDDGAQPLFLIETQMPNEGTSTASRVS
jgi:hypothetical protein